MLIWLIERVASPADRTSCESALELMLLKTLKKYAKGLLLLVEDLMLLIAHRLLVHKQSFLLVVLDLSKVANPYIRLRDKDLLKSKDPQVVSEPFGRTLNKKNLLLYTRDFSDPMESLSPQVILNGNSSIPTRVVDGVVQGVNGTWIQVSHGLGPQKTLTFLFDVLGNPHQALKDKGVIESGCLIHMTGNIFISLTLKKSTEDMLHLVEIEKVNSVLFIDTECVVLSSDFKLPDENHVLLRVPKENNMYNVDLKNIVPLEDLTCLFAKATLDESNLWHRRLGHIKFKTMNKLVKGNLVRGLPSKVFENNHTCVVCKKGKQYRAS
nr:putative ribonuclease H-like domain-containing protein [Tanacetum cinerariifolium]